MSSAKNLMSLPSALNRMDEISKKLQNKTPAIFLDYDGTLTPIVDKPSDAKISEEMRSLVEQLANDYFVAVLSGRDLEDVRKLLGIESIIYAGSHGLDVAGPGDEYRKEYGKEFLSSLDKAEKEVGKKAEDIEGVIIERKRFSIAVHYRNVDDSDVDRVEQCVDRVLDRHKNLKKGYGKKVYELKPNIDWDKGRALLSLVDDFFEDKDKVVPIYIGDDITDEDAFKAILSEGIGIIVGKEDRETYADYRLENTEDVKELLRRLNGKEEEVEMSEEWKFFYSGYNPEEEKHREALCTVGNGYFATRGAAPESTADNIHYPGTYIAGCYNRLKTKIEDQVIENESLVNIPNWLPFNFRMEDGEWFSPDKFNIKEYRQELDIKKALLKRTLEFSDEKGRRTKIIQSRLASMSSPHLAALKTTVVAENWSGKMRFKSCLDGRVANAGVERYSDLNSIHIEFLDASNVDDEIITLQVQTNQSHIYISEAARTRVFAGGNKLNIGRNVIKEPGFIAQEFELELSEGEEISIEKVVSIYTSKDRAISESSLQAIKDDRRAPDFSEILRDHITAWRHLWERCKIDIEFKENNADAKKILLFHILHLLQTVSVNTIDLDAGVPPRGLHGEAYRGHIMWDELFIFPFLNLRIPDITRSLLQYRYRRLPAARRLAEKEAYKGALYPWQSGSDGREESQVLHLNPRSGRWIPDNSNLQRHIDIAVAYNVWHYYEATGDVDYLAFYGAETVLEIARFWSSIAAYNTEKERYEIRNVMGPDEFHDSYPDAEEPGLNNNAYTNIMAVWVICRAMDILKLLPDERCRAVRENLKISEEELKLWDEVSRKMFVPFHEDCIISQFEGYDELKEFDWEGYRKKYGDIQRLDRILEAEDDSPNRYKVSKQADVLMLFYLLSSEELENIFNRLDYKFDCDWIPKNVDYYLERTSHGSTLSRIVHSWVAARTKRELSWDLFMNALKSDIEDVQGGTTKEGIHLGAMAGTVDLMQRCYSGLETRGDILRFNPALPEELKRLEFNIYYRGQWINVRIDSKKIRLRARESDQKPIKIAYCKNETEIKPGQELEFRLNQS